MCTPMPTISIFTRIHLSPAAGSSGYTAERGTVRVNSLHHQAVKDLGKQMVAEALSVPDGIIEAMRWQGPRYVVGVQWHPEFVDPKNPEVLQGDALLMEYLTVAVQARGVDAAARH